MQGDVNGPAIGILLSYSYSVAAGRRCPPIMAEVENDAAISTAVLLSWIKCLKEMGFYVHDRRKKIEPGRLSLTVQESIKATGVKGLIRDVYEACITVHDPTVRGELLERLLEIRKRFDRIDEIISECNAWYLKQKAKDSLMSIAKCTISTHQWKELTGLIHNRLCEVDNDIQMLKEDVEEERAHQVCPSMTSVFAISEPDNPVMFPSSVTLVEAKPQQQYMTISWKDTINKSEDLLHYKIYITKTTHTGTVSLQTDKVNVTGSVSYSRSLGPLEGWCTYFVKICAVNRENLEGETSSPIPVFMNQYPPTVKPCGLKVIDATSHTSVMLEVDRPDLYDDMRISQCLITGKEIVRKIENDTTPIVNSFKKMIDLPFSSGSTKTSFKVDGLQPEAEYTLQMLFCNEYGSDEKFISEELPPFMIKAMTPSSPLITYVTENRSAIIVKFETEINAGSVSYYNLYIKKGRNGKWSLDSKSETAEKCKVATELTRYSTYYFYAESVSLSEHVSEKSNELKVKLR